MSSPNFDAQILAARQAKNVIIKKVGIFSFAAIAGVTVVYFGASYVANNTFSSSEPEQIQGSKDTDQNETSNTADTLRFARAELQQKLVFAENAVADIEQDTGRNNYNTNAIVPLRNTLQLALGSYSSENYQQAGRQLEQLKNAVTEFEKGYAQTWQTAWQAAQTAFSQAQQDSAMQTGSNSNTPDPLSTDAITQAQLHNQRVLHINPGFGPAQDLRARLDVWQDLQQYKEKLRVAEVENNMNKQLTLSQKMLALDPGDQEIAQNISRLQETLKQQRFNEAIVVASDALNRGDIAATSAVLQRAQAIDTGRAEVAQLKQELDDILKNKSVARFEQQIATMQSADNWAAVQRLSASAKAKHPQHANFELSLQLANQILDYQRQLNDYLAAPARLADGNIQNNAQRLLAEVAPVEVASAGLKNTADALRTALQDSQQTMAVTVISDGRTDIRVLGTGIVGKTREKVIQLLPGNYRFEGRRKGYQSKIVSFTVRANDQVQTITLVCDKKI